MTNNPSQPHHHLLPNPHLITCFLSKELWSVISYYWKHDYPTGILHTLTENFLKVTFPRCHRNSLSLLAEAAQKSVNRIFLCWNVLSKVERDVMIVAEIIRPDRSFRKIPHSLVNLDSRGFLFLVFFTLFDLL